MTVGTKGEDTLNARETQSNVDEKFDHHAIAAREEGSSILKTSRDGQSLHPQPTVDPNDPLNWPQRRKNLILLVVSATAFIADYGSAVGSVTLIPQAK